MTLDTIGALQQVVSPSAVGLDRGRRKSKWVGWRGDISSESWRSGYDYMKESPDEFYEQNADVWQQTSWHIVSTIQWYYLGAAEDVKTPVCVSGHRYRDDPPQPENSLQDGWTCHVCPISSKTFFCHKLEMRKQFWYRIPLVDTEGPQVPPHIHAGFLWGGTRRTFIRLGAPFRLPNMSQCECTGLLDGDGEWIGTLRLHSNDEAALLEGQEIEEVSFDEWEHVECPRRSRRYDFYNVMAVERVW